MKTEMTKTVFVAAALVALLAAVCQAEAPVVVSGASLLGDLVHAFADAFDKEIWGCNFIVNGHTTELGVEDLLQGKAQIAMTSRKMSDHERARAASNGVQIAEQHMGKIPIAVIVNSGNSVKELTMEQLRKIFNGEYTNWNQVGGKNETILVTTRAVRETEAGVEFQKIVSKGANYAKGHQVMSTYRDTVYSCSKSSAIGYIPTTSPYFHQMYDRGVKTVPVKAGDGAVQWFPAEGLVNETDYPITIPFYLYWNAKAESPCVRIFPVFCEREKGKIRPASR